MDHNPSSNSDPTSNSQFIFSTVNGSDLYMNSCLYGNGTSFVESLFEDFGELLPQSAVKHNKLL